MTINFKTLLIIILIFILILLAIEPFNENINYTNDYLNGIDIIYWINLDKSVNRRNDMELMFQNDVFKNIPNKRIAAINGNSEYIDSIMNYYFNDFKYEFYSKGEYGCTLSHLLAILEFHNSNYEVGLIMEDDMSIKYKDYWKESVKSCMENAPKDWELLQLTYITYFDTIPSEIYRKSERGTGTGAYLITKKGSTKLLNALYNKDNNKFDLNNKGDLVADSILFRYLISYNYKYPYFVPTNNDSEIHPDHVELYHMPSNNTLEIILKDIINFSRDVLSSIPV